MELVLLYLWLKLDVLTNAGIAATVGLVMWGFWCFIYGAEHAPRADESKWYKAGRHRLALAVVVGLVNSAMPSSRDVAILVGASYAIDLAKSETGKKVQTLIVGKANQMLDAEISKLQPK
jgi:hypothetical protein